MRIFRSLVGFAVGVAISIPAALGAGEMYQLLRTHPGRADLLAEAMRITGRTCGTAADEKAAREDGERGRHCEAPEIVERDLSAIGAAGAYDPTVRPRVVYVDFKGIARFNADPENKGNEIAPDETILHEYVHYLQWLNGDLTPKMNPCQRVALEIEAHKADQEYSTPGEIGQRTKEIISSYYFIAMLAESEGKCN